MKVTFDSNVWRIIASPEVFPNEPFINAFRKIRQAIIDGKIIPFIAETVFTIESIRKKDRKEIIGNSNARVDARLEESDDGMTHISFIMGPKSAMNYDDNPILKRHFNDAIALGFNIVRLPRIAGYTNIEVDDVRYVHPDDELSTYHEKVFEVVKKIEEAGAGMSHIVSIGKAYNSHWIDGIKKAPESIWGEISKAAAEWADGDSVAICVALGCEFFCTRDKAKSAGNKSVFGNNNIKWLNNEYGLNVVLPNELSELLM